MRAARCTDVQLRVQCRRRRCRSGCAPGGHRLSPSAPRRPAPTGRHQARADDPPKQWIPRPTHRLSRLGRAAGRGSGSPCGCCAHRPGVRCSAAPGANPPAGEPVPHRCRATSCRCARAARKLRHGSAAPRNGGGAGTGGTSPARPNSHAASADDRMPSPSTWVACSTATVPTPAPGTSVDGCEHVQPPRHPAGVQLVFGQPRDRRQTSRPAVVGEIVHDELVGLDVAGHPRRIGEGVALLDPQPQLGAVLRARRRIASSACSRSDGTPAKPYSRN